MVEPVLERLRDAIQAYANEYLDDGPCLLSEAVVVFECVSYTEDAQAGRCISYTIPTDNFSLSGALGLLDAGQYYVRRDILHENDDD